MQTLLRCPYSLRAQLHASTSVRTLKIPSAGSHTIVWTGENTAHTDRSGYSAARATDVPYPNFRQSDNKEQTKKSRTHTKSQEVRAELMIVFPRLSDVDLKKKKKFFFNELHH